MAWRVATERRPFWTLATAPDAYHELILLMLLDSFETLFSVRLFSISAFRVDQPTLPIDFFDIRSPPWKAGSVRRCSMSLSKVLSLRLLILNGILNVSYTMNDRFKKIK